MLTNNLNNILITEYYGVENILNKDVINGIKKNLYLSINITDTDNEHLTYETKLDLINYFSNTHLAYFKNNDLVNETKEINTAFNIDEAVLVKNKFQKDNITNIYNKEINKNLSINVDIKSQKVTVYLKSKNTNYIYYVYYSQNYFKFISSNKDSNVNYDYHYIDDILKCYKGKCDTYIEDSEYVLNLMNKLF